MEKKSKNRSSLKRLEQPRKEKSEIKELKLTLSQEEINSLEKMIKEDKGKTSFSEVQELLRNPNINSSPSLKKINTPEKSQVILERDIITGNMSITNLGETKKSNSGELNYIPSTIEEEKKYTPHYGERIATLTQKREIEKTSPENLFGFKEIRVGDSFKEKMQEPESFEKYSSPRITMERFDVLKKPKKDPFDKKEVKYTPSGY